MSAFFLRRSGARSAALARERQSWLPRTAPVPARTVAAHPNRGLSDERRSVRLCVRARVTAARNDSAKTARPGTRE